MPTLALCIQRHTAIFSKQNPLDFQKHNLLRAEILVKESDFTYSEEQNRGEPSSDQASLPHRSEWQPRANPGSK